MTPINASATFGPRAGRGRRSLPTPLLGFVGGALAALAASALTFPNMAMAQERRQVVRYADLDLTNPEGIASLERRVAWAARRVCVGPESAGHLVSNPRRCIEEAVNSASPQIEEAVARRRAAIMVYVAPTDVRSR
ncbi:UrcA family protein [Brevundimonas lenta]|uniref:UrcA family protein n=1 Tax=Brevundimonas lenta TaxID=424796 RepID=A0A7W6JEB5_9CAUL|nr:UrcA family protein [Brevundimonas lenta]MBB4083544.1 UrcA family protein [Brevundimonas lenta]